MHVCHPPAGGPTFQPTRVPCTLYHTPCGLYHVPLYHVPLYPEPLYHVPLYHVPCTLSPWPAPLMAAPSI